MDHKDGITELGTMHHVLCLLSIRVHAPGISRGGRGVTICLFEFGLRLLVLIVLHDLGDSARSVVVVCHLCQTRNVVGFDDVYWLVKLWDEVTVNGGENYDKRPSLFCVHDCHPKI